MTTIDPRLVELAARNIGIAQIGICETPNTTLAEAAIVAVYELITEQAAAAERQRISERTEQMEQQARVSLEIAERAQDRRTELTEQNAKLRKALDGRRRETRRSRRKLEAARAVLRAIADRVDLMQSEIADHQAPDYDATDPEATYRAGFVMGGYAEHEQITHDLRELLDRPATRQAQSEAVAEPALARLATADQIRDALRGAPLVDGVVYPTLTMDEALGHLADRVLPEQQSCGRRTAHGPHEQCVGLPLPTVPRSLLDDALPPPSDAPGRIAQYLLSGQALCCKCDHPMTPTGVCSNTGRCPQAVTR